jgi:hypothetical protein
MKTEGLSKRFQDLPEVLFRAILEFTAPRHEQHRWLWMSQIGATCHDFYDVTRQLSPRSLNLEQTIQFHHAMSSHGKIPPHLKGPFLKSFLTAPWKANRLEHVRLHHQIYPGCATRDAVCRSMETLLVMSGLLVNVQSLEVSLKSMNNAACVLNGDSLCRLAQNLVRLESLSLVSCFGDRQITPAEFGRFAQLLSGSFFKLKVGGAKWMTAEHIRCLVSVRADTLQSLELLNCFSYVCGRRPRERIYLDDGALGAIAIYCHNLQQVSITNAEITVRGLSVVFRANPSLAHLNVSLCGKLGSASVDDIVSLLVTSAPQLQSLRVDYCRWFTIEVLYQYLLQLHLHWQRPQNVPLQSVSVVATSVTEDEVRSILPIIANEKLTIHGGRWSVSNCSSS